VPHCNSISDVSPCGLNPPPFQIPPKYLGPVHHNQPGISHSADDTSTADRPGKLLEYRIPRPTTRQIATTGNQPTTRTQPTKQRNGSISEIITPQQLPVDIASSLRKLPTKRGKAKRSKINQATQHGNPEPHRTARRPRQEQRNPPCSSCPRIPSLLPSSRSPNIPNGLCLNWKGGRLIRIVSRRGVRCMMWTC